MKLIDLTGQRFNRIFVESRAPNNKNGSAQWNCVCDCGNKTIVYGASLRGKITKSCGCLAKEKNIARRTTHGMSKIAEYNTWIHLKQRCSNPMNKNYHRYGGRGITVCERWFSSFAHFFTDLGPKPSPNHSIERIDNNGNYSPENTRWGNATDQANNTRRNTVIEFRGETKTLPEWCRLLNLNYDATRQRINRLKWSPEKSFTMPVSKKFHPNH